MQTAVAPSISFGRLNGFVTRVFAGRSMARKQVQLQRFSSFGQWVTIKRVTLDLSSRARFQARAPVGANRLRIAMSVNQAGAGLPRRLQPGDRLRAARAEQVPLRRKRRGTERPRSRTEQAVVCTTGPILKTGWATGPVPLRTEPTQ